MLQQTFKAFELSDELSVLFLRASRALEALHDVFDKPARRDEIASGEAEGYG